MYLNLRFVDPQIILEMLVITEINALPACVSHLLVRYWRS